MVQILEGWRKELLEGFGKVQVVVEIDIEVPKDMHLRIFGKKRTIRKVYS